MVFGQDNKTRWLPALAAVCVSMLAGALPASAGEPLLRLATLKTGTASFQAMPSTRPTTAVSLRTETPSAKSPAPADVDLEELSTEKTGPTNAPSLSVAQQPSRDVLVPEPRGDGEPDRRSLLAGARVQAGLGQIFHDRSDAIYGRNGTKLEEPSCGYLKISFRF